MQLVKFGVVDAVATLVDAGVLVAVKELLHMDVLNKMPQRGFFRVISYRVG